MWLFVTSATKDDALALADDSPGCHNFIFTDNQQNRAPSAVLPQILKSGSSDVYLAVAQMAHVPLLTT